MLVIQRAKMCEIASALEFKSTGDVGDFSKCFLQLAIPIGRGILIEKVVGKCFEIFRAQREARLKRLHGKRITLWVVTAGC